MGYWKTFLTEGKVRAKTQKWKIMVHVKKRDNSILLDYRAWKGNNKRSLESYVDFGFSKFLNYKLRHLN